MRKLYRVQNIIFSARVHPRPRDAVAGDVISVTVTEEHTAFMVWLERAIDKECNNFTILEVFAFNDLHARDLAIEYAVEVKSEQLRLKEAA
jgi:hypothetical protein